MRLFAKLLVVVVALGATGLALLALRQQRYEVSNEISRTHNSIVEQERARWRLRAEVARLSDPADIRAAAERRGIDLAPVQEANLPAEPSVGTKSPAPAAKGAATKPGAATPKSKAAAAKPANTKQKAGTRDRR